MQVQKLRIQHGWSQQQLADLSGLNVRTIQRIENGASASVESLKSLAAVFEVEFSTLKEQSTMNTTAPPLASNEAMSHEEFLAYRQVRKLKGFYIHLAQYLLVIPLLFLINYLTGVHQHIWWAGFPALGWGLGLTIHGLMISPWIAKTSTEWESRKVQEYLSS
jgi:transcriptional regulator with XRE-family HTH domain